MKKNLLLFFLCCMGGFAGCKSQKIPTDFSLSFGVGGGFTGRWNGYAIDHLGNIHEWQGLGSQKQTAPIGVLSKKELQTLLKTFQKAKFEEINRDETANMTVQITLSQRGKIHSVRFPLSNEPTTSDQDPVTRLYALCMQAIRNVSAQIP
ncbi:MAG: hypothetical protein JNN12_13000 [Bacteroidetes Order II. Incertae sedis bacterium]|nr:hypothetical protein [Bacteroidetes Order II. bacterium]